jgi:hypothetical protein
MDEDLQSWVKNAETIPGVLACGARRANQSVAKSCHKDFPQPQFEKLMREIAESIRLLQTNNVPTEKVRWTFERAWVYSAIRRDGAIATMIVDKEYEASEQIDQLLSDFRKPVPS